LDNFPKTFVVLKRITLLTSFTLVFFLTLFYNGNEHTLSDYESPVISNSNIAVKDISTQVKQTKFKEPIRPRDPKAIALENYLRRQDSPLHKHSDLIIELSKLYGVDYKMIIAIAGLESGYCEINIGKNNCWGFGSYSWPTLETGIREYFRLMNKGYFSKGRNTIQEIAPIYNSANTENFMSVYNIHYIKIP